MNRIGRSALAVALVLAAVAAGAPLLAADGCEGIRGGCPMMTGGVHRAATRASCATGASFAPALSCCATEAAPAPAPTGAAAPAPTATAPGADASGVDAVAGEPRLPAPTAPAADRARAERRHALGLFTLHAQLLS